MDPVILLHCRSVGSEKRANGSHVDLVDNSTEVLYCKAVLVVVPEALPQHHVAQLIRRVAPTAEPLEIGEHLVIVHHPLLDFVLSRMARLWDDVSGFHSLAFADWAWHWDFGPIVSRSIALVSLTTVAIALTGAAAIAIPVLTVAALTGAAAIAGTAGAGAISRRCDRSSCRSSRHLSPAIVPFQVKNQPAICPTMP
jgi:hypothetical protein